MVPAEEGIGAGKQKSVESVSFPQDKMRHKPACVEDRMNWREC